MTAEIEVQKTTGEITLNQRDSYFAEDGL